MTHPSLDCKWSLFTQREINLQNRHKHNQRRNEEVKTVSTHNTALHQLSSAKTQHEKLEDICVTTVQNIRNSFCSTA